ncbi:TonB-dependent siderophore receptor [Candidatus Nitrotoga sp. M5]|uniref:TonB-dependent siderophore receptor n=1 Tax=Candidatus Nitrotoga sp. M5 TaxID=2890409 RepID=UPI001EF2B710|nr:TonB-dependent siderophore receptor [Candidatus Nitrotoga sp. M5]CAH1386612.1 Ferrichrome-iron receptor [Candidatus Nitrotoga sp. M5]
MQFRLSVVTSALSLAFSASCANAQTSVQSEPSTVVPVITEPSTEVSVVNESTKELPVVNVAAERAGSFKSNFVQVGTFRDMAPLDIPQTSNVITREVLDAQATTSLFGALRNTAGVTRSAISGSTYDNIAIRGILVENRGNYRLNGSLPIINLISTPVENKERVEVLKGASSLYYGFVPPSGIINLVTKRAGNTPVTNLKLLGNQHGGGNAHLDVGRRFGNEQQFGVRVNLLKGREDTGIDHYSGDRMLASGAFDWRVNDKLSFKFDVEHYTKDVSEQPPILVPAAVNGVITLPSVPDNRQNLSGNWQRYDAKATNLLFRTDYALSDNWGVFFEAGKARTVRDRAFSRFENYDLTTGQGTLNTTSFTRGQEFDNENYRAEIYGRLPGTWITHELSLGFTANERSQDGQTFTGVTNPQNLYNPVAIAPQFPVGESRPSFPGTIRDRGWYLFDRMLIGKWQAMVGARGSNYKSTTPNSRYTADKVTPTFALMYKPISNVSLYGSYLEGLEESDTVGPDRANFGQVLPPALSKQKEIGIKAEVAQGILLQAAYFDIERASTAIDSVTNNLTLNGLAQYRGVELVASGEITKRLSLVASAVFQNAKQLNADNAATFNKTPDNTPEQTASLFSEYRLQSVPGLALSGGLYYVGKRPVNNQNQAFVDDYTTVSMGARHTTIIDGKRTTFQAVLDNATDKNYWGTAGSNLLGVGAPRTLTVTAQMQF